MAKITYIGTPGDETEEITVYGETFAKDKAVTLDDDHEVVGKLEGNPTFKVERSKTKG